MIIAYLVHYQHLKKKGGPNAVYRKEYDNQEPETISQSQGILSSSHEITKS